VKREDLIKKLNINILNKQKNVFLDTDFANEADDPFAVIHYILSPSINLVGIGVEHFNKKNSDSSCDKSYTEIKKMLDIIKLDDDFVYMGSNKPLDLNNIIDNPASLKIIEEAKKADVPFYKDDKLADTLSKLEIGDMIPPELYEVVAEILVYVNDMDKLRAKYGG
jgi:hypothetical protein